MRIPRAETTPTPRVDEVVVFVAFFDVGLQFPYVELVARVLRLYRVELTQLTPNSLVKLTMFEWICALQERVGRGAHLHTCTTGGVS